jgi:hypothetical protein
MPVFQRVDARGYYFQWGDTGKKYYFDPSSLVSSARARQKAHKQGRAVRARQGAAGEPKR